MVDAQILLAGPGLPKPFLPILGARLNKDYRVPLCWETTMSVKERVSCGPQEGSARMECKVAKPQNGLFRSEGLLYAPRDISSTRPPNFVRATLSKTASTYHYMSYEGLLQARMFV